MSGITRCGAVSGEGILSAAPHLRPVAACDEGHRARRHVGVHLNLQVPCCESTVSGSRRNPVDATFGSQRQMAVQRDPILEWRERYARCCLTVDFEPLPGATFCASVKPIFPELRTAQAALSAGFLFRDDDLLRDGNDSLEVIVAQSRELNITHQGREVRLAPGDATIMQA